MSKTSGYSLWLTPDVASQEYRSLSANIAELAGVYGTPLFEPHVTLIGGIQGTEAEVRARTQELADRLSTFTVQLGAIGSRGSYHQSLFICADPSGELLRANAVARGIFSIDTGDYFPHVSLAYGDFSPEQLQSLRTRLASGSPIPGTVFAVSGITLWRCDGEVREWKKVADVPFAGEASAAKKLSIIIPAYNEEKTISELIRRVKDAPLALEKEIVVVDNGSTDRTQGILAGENSIVLVTLDPNRGKGGAIKAGLEKATGDLVIFQDADLEYDPRDYPAMIAPLLDGRTEAVMGVRRETDHDAYRWRSPYYFISWIGNHLITWTTNALFSNDAGEYEGCYKAFTKRLLDTIEVRTNGFAYDNELVCKILKRGNKTVDVPIRYQPRSYEAGKHIRWRDGLLILWTIIRCRFTD